MYSKIAMNNVKKSLKDYTIYFFTLTLAVCIFYSFNSIESQKALLELNKGNSEILKILSSILALVSIFISIMLGLLLVYANNFLIKKRKKEFGIYMILGMKRTRISKILITETLIIGIMSLIVGLLMGIIVSQGVSLFTVRLLGVGIEKYKFLISMKTINKTIVYFGIIFLLVMIFNTRVISKYKLIDMINFKTKTLNLKTKNTLLTIIIFIISIFIFVKVYTDILKIGFSPDKYRFWLVIFMGIIGTVLWFFTFNNFFSTVIKKINKIYFKNLNIFSINQINCKASNNFISMTVICFMLSLTIGILSSGVAFKDAMEKSIEKNTPFDASCYINVSSKDSTSMSMKNILDEFGIGPSDLYKYEDYNIYVGSGNLIDKINESLDVYGINKLKLSTYGFNIIKVSDFNNIRKLQGRSSVELKEDEALIRINERGKDIVSKFLSKNNEVNIDGKNYYFRNKEIYTDALETSVVDENSLTLIISDYSEINLIPIKKVLNINYGDSNKEQSEEEFSKLFNDYMQGKAVKGKPFIIGYTREQVHAENRGIATIVVFIGIYLGIIFLICSAAVLAIGQLSEAIDSIDRYESLRRIGASKEMIDKTIFIETLIYFMTPLSLALIHSFIAIIVVNDFISIWGGVDLFVSALIAYILVVIIYSVYFYATYTRYKSLIKLK